MLTNNAGGITVAPAGAQVVGLPVRQVNTTPVTQGVPQGVNLDIASQYMMISHGVFTHL